MKIFTLLRNQFLTIFLILFLVLISCKSSHSKFINKSLGDSFYKNQFTGLLIYNPENKDTIINYNAEKYFTPASNTKIFTLYSALHFLPSRAPAFKYKVKEDTLFIQGTGDPTFLHNYFNDSTALKMAKDYAHLKLRINNLVDDKYGPGWAWEDYDTYFSPERSALPMYGNVLTIGNSSQNQWSCKPELMKDSIYLASSKKRRKYFANQFYYNPKRIDTIEVPMVIDSTLIKAMWENLLPIKVYFSEDEEQINEVAYSVSTDSLCKRMMTVSDNFLAEQLLILSSSQLTDTLNSGKLRRLVLDSLLPDLKQRPRWVDGSGLSRYNLFTPQSFVRVLSKLYEEVPQERLFNLFPVGGKSGTLKRYYSGNTRPYIYAKSGTVGNNYALSGYLKTNSNKILIFSFMNNHYTTSTTAVKNRMEIIFEWLRDNY